MGGGVRVKSPIHFHCVLHAKRGEGAQMTFTIVNRRPLSNTHWCIICLNLLE